MRRKSPERDEEGEEKKRERKREEEGVKLFHDEFHDLHLIQFRPPQPIETDPRSELLICSVSIHVGIRRVQADFRLI